MHKINFLHQHQNPAHSCVRAICAPLKDTLMRHLILAIAALFATASPALAQQPTQVVGPQTMNTGQVTVASATAPQLVLPARPYRQRTTVLQTAANQCAFGGPSVTASSGFTPTPVAGANFTYDNASPLYAVCAASTVVTFLEGY